MLGGNPPGTPRENPRGTPPGTPPGDPSGDPSGDPAGDPPGGSPRGTPRRIPPGDPPEDPTGDPPGYPPGVSPEEATLGGNAGSQRWKDRVQRISPLTNNDSALERSRTCQIILLNHRVDRMIRPQMEGGGRGRLGGGFLYGFTLGNLTKTYSKSTQTTTPNPSKSMEIH